MKTLQGHSQNMRAVQKETDCTQPLHRGVHTTKELKAKVCMVTASSDSNTIRTGVQNHIAPKGMGASCQKPQVER